MSTMLELGIMTAAVAAAVDRALKAGCDPNSVENILGIIAQDAANWSNDDDRDDDDTDDADEPEPAPMLPSSRFSVG